MVCVVSVGQSNGLCTNITRRDCGLKSYGEEIDYNVGTSPLISNEFGDRHRVFTWYQSGSISLHILKIYSPHLTITYQLQKDCMEGWTNNG